MDFADYSRFVLVFLFVMALLMTCAWAVRRFGLLGMGTLEKKQENSLHLVGALTLDPKRRLVAVAFGSRHYLVLLGPTGEQILETPLAADELNLTDPLPQEPIFEYRRGL